MNFGKSINSFQMKKIDMLPGYLFDNFCYQFFETIILQINVLVNFKG